ncbi:hypothetical protein ACHHYP_05796 [Achlya hypogyna]|uniref:F-box domain-containing protein n=1 Tax=Achlya hypogyna TaxID=1202772 RepID=A0A1V9YWW7_ACHHY|nr:hypothetical protein ACHHYP_05796 [Achlya hypogyna]
MGLTELPDVFLAEICAGCSVADLGALLLVSRGYERLFHAYFVAACKRYCFLDFLTPTIAAYRMAAPIPTTWPKLYETFTSNRNMTWTACEPALSASLRKLKIDPTEYTVDGANLLRCGGHYLFGLWQIRFADVSIAPGNIDDDSYGTLEMGSWEKLRPLGSGPCPRRGHTATALPPLFVEKTVSFPDEDYDGHHWRRLLIFGGQAEGYPFQAFNDLYLCCQTKARGTGETRAYWVEPETAGLPPGPRCGHVATVLDPMTVLFSGGSSGTTPIPTLEIYLLHQLDGDYGDTGLGAYRWSQPVYDMYPPMGRTLHAVFQPDRAKHQLVVFGGKQIRESNGLLDCHYLSFCDDALTTCAWSTPALEGNAPKARRGHSSMTIGHRYLLVFGGQENESLALDNTTYELDAKRLRWTAPPVRGNPPSARRGHKLQYFGSRMVVQSGFVLNTDGRANVKLPDTDTHVLSFL